MLVNYIYTTRTPELITENVYGPYEVDSKDFKNFFKHLPAEVNWIRVEHRDADGTLMVWSWVRNSGWAKPYEGTFTNEYIVGYLTSMLVHFALQA